MCDVAIIKGKKYVQVLFYSYEQTGDNPSDMQGYCWDTERIEYDTYRDCHDPRTSLWCTKYEVVNYFAIQLFKHLRKLNKDGELDEIRQLGFVAVCPAIGTSEYVSIVKITTQQAQYWLDYENNRSKQ